MEFERFQAEVSMHQCQGSQGSGEGWGVLLGAVLSRDGVAEVARGTSLAVLWGQWQEEPSVAVDG